MNHRKQILRRAMFGVACAATMMGSCAVNAQTTSPTPEPTTTAPPPSTTAATTTTQPSTTAPASPVVVLTPIAINLQASGGSLHGSAGRIRTFAGDLWGSAGRIRSFSGQLSGKAGRIRTFSDKDGAILTIEDLKNNQNFKTFYENIKSLRKLKLNDPSFWGKVTLAPGVIAPSKATIDAFELAYQTQVDALFAQFAGYRDADGLLKSYDQNAGGYDKILASLKKIVADSKLKWGAAITSQTGKSFEEAIAARLLAKYEIDLSNARSLEGLDEASYLLFLIDWHDNMYSYSGRDHVDSWMAQVNWSPSLTQQATGPNKAKIGLLDYTVTGAESANITVANGISAVSGGHGDAVASLLVAGHNGRGSLGIAPNASIVSYNPFDSTGTAGWADAKTGIDLFTASGATIVNVSLGVPGWTFHEGWNALFADGKAKSQLYVFAAGNDGTTQTSDVAWSFDRNPGLLVVGSVDPTNNISAFSNRPGSACLLTAGVCASSNDLLMNRFIVAPGEFILVSDGLGGVTRVSGTSFATPLVTGTATLIEQRWSWLAKRPNVVADIILNSARDLGAPGVDPVFGHGMLDVAAALSPLSFDRLTYKVNVNGTIKDVSVTSIPSTANANKAIWETSGAYLSLFEQLDTRDSGAYRDFVVPMSNKLVGKTVGTSGYLFQAYVTNRFWDWVATKRLNAAPESSGFAENQLTSAFGAFGGMTAAMRIKGREYRPGLRTSNLPFESTLLLTSNDEKFGFLLGSGNGAVALGERSGFALSSDFDISSGGANPFLAMASGSGFASANVAIDDKLSISAGITSQNAEQDSSDLTLTNRAVLGGLNSYRATADNMSVSYKAANWLTTNFSYTLLHEKNSLLGVRSLDPTDFKRGSTTDALTYGVDMKVTPSLALTASGTLGRTRAGNLAEQNIGVSRAGLLSSAFQVGLTKTKLFARNDSARLTLAQPMHLERGAFDYNSVEVIDRETGEIGSVRQKLALQTQRRNFVAEAIYRHPLAGGLGEFSLSGRARLGQDEQSTREADVIVGAGLKFAF